MGNAIGPERNDMTQMPIINIDYEGLNLLDNERELVKQILKSDNSLYASKPKKASGEAKYLWRMVVFGISPIPAHHCLPVMADMDLEGKYSETRDKAEELNDLAARIEKTIPVLERHGLISWYRVMGGSL